MKKTLLTLFILTLFLRNIYSVEINQGICLSCIAPFYTGQGFSEGYIQALEDSGYSNLKNNPKLSLAIGISFEISFSTYIAAQPELRFSSNGGGVRGKDPDTNSFSRIIDESNMEIPLLMKCIIPLEKDRIYFISGPVLTVLIGTPTIKDKNGHDFSKKNLTRKNFFAWGIAAEAGLGYDFSVKDGYFFIEGRYSYEFTDSMRNYGNGFNQNCIYIGCGYRFGKQNE